MFDFDQKIDNTAPAASGRLPAVQFNNIANELENAVSTTGQTLDATGTNVLQLAEAMARYASGGVWFQDTGQPNAYVLGQPSTFITPKSTFNRQFVWFLPAYTNTGASVANVGATGNKPIVDHTGAGLTGGEIVANRPVCLYKENGFGVGGSWVLPPWVNALFSAGGGGGGGGGSSLVLHPNAARWAGVELAYIDNTTVKLKAGECWSDDLVDIMKLPNDLNIDLTSTGAGKLDTGALAAGWYDIYMIKNTSTGAVSGVATAGSSPTMPSGYTEKRYIGSFKVDASVHVVPFDQYGALVKFRIPQYDTHYVSDAAYQGPGGSGNQMSSIQTVAMSVPRRRRVIGNFLVSLRLDAPSASQGCLYVFASDDTPSRTVSGFESDTTKSIQQEPAIAGTNGLPWWAGLSVNYVTGFFRILSDTSGQISAQVSLADGYNPHIALRTISWEYT